MKISNMKYRCIFLYQRYLKNKILFILIKFNVTFKNNYCFFGPSYEIRAYYKITYISSYGFIVLALCLCI